MIDVSGLVKRCLAGNTEAARALIELQKDGKARRLYPFGRVGATDEGMTPVVFAISSNGMIQLERGRIEELLLPHASVASVMEGLAMLCGFAWIEHEDCDDRAATMLAKETPGLDVTTRYTPTAFGLLALPGRYEVEMGISTVMELMSIWCTFIEQSEKPYSDFGFTDDEVYYNLLDFCVPA